MSMKRPPIDSLTTEPVAARRKRNMTPKLEHLPNRLSKFDQEISDAFGGDDSTANGGFTIFHASFLLSTIVSHSTSVGQMDPKYRDACAALTLLKSDNKLVALLKAAWEKKSFVEVQTDSRLSLKPHLHTVTTSSDISSTQVVSEAWKTPYIGNYHKLLFDNINRMKRSGLHSNSVAIVQSSGYGKSRMVEEQSDLVFTIPFNLRSPRECSAFAYPPSDGIVYDHLTVSLGVDEVTTRYVTFLCAVFQQVTIELEDVDEQDSYESLARSWRLHLEKAGNRSRIYRAAVQRAEDFILCDNYRLLRHQAVPTENAISKAAQDALAELLKKMAHLCKSQHDFTSSNDVKVMIYFDEAHVLAPGSDGQRDLDRVDNYDIMCSCFNLFLGFPFFAIFLSTNSCLSRMARMELYSRSVQYRRNPENLQTPITGTPFDCSPDFPLKPDNLTLDNLCTIKTLASFGRPMFWALLNSPLRGDAAFESTALSLARSKLLCEPNIHKSISEYSDSSKMALVDVLLNLEFEPRREATYNWQANLVASHMRTAYFVPQDRSFMLSGYPSEPLLAEAATQQIHAFQRHQTQNVMAEILCNNFQHGFLDQGQRGEVVCRLLLMTAYMRSVVKDHPDSCPNFSRGCRLATFITELFAEEYSNQVLTSLPDNIKSNIPFSDAFSHAVIRFTHFGRMADDSGMTTYASLAAFIRGMAMIGCPSQDGVDIMIPILLDPTKKLSESVMSGVLIQVKRRETLGTKPAYAVDQKSCNLFPSINCMKIRPYATIVVALEVQRRDWDVPIRTPVLKSSPTADLMPIPPSMTLHQSKDTHPRYSIFAYGCSETVYKVIHPFENVAYQFLLGSSQQDQVSLAAVQRLKPFWMMGEQSYHWIEEPFLHQRVGVNNLEGVFIRQFDDHLPPCLRSSCCC